MDGRVKVLYIAGAGRSGCTILEKILSGIEGFCGVGELDYVWERGLLNNQLCGCNVPFRKCDFWKDVFRQAFGGMEKVDATSILELRNSVARLRHLPLHILQPSAFQEKVSAYAERLARIYSAIGALTRGGVIIDFSKRAYGHILLQIPQIDLYIIHLVRDSRATVFSWTRQGVYEEQEDGRIMLPQFHPLQSSLHWIFDNLSVEMLRKTPQRMFMRYEDFVHAPTRFIAEILDFVGETATTLPFVDEHMVELKANHSVAGNPVRFKNGTIKIKEDDEWKTNMPLATRRIVTALSWFLLRRYGYLSSYSRTARTSAKT